MIKEGGDQYWGADDHLYGPVSLGLAASALNEVAQYCEDLFALTAFIREPYDGSPWFRVSGDVVLAGHAASRAVA